MDDVSATVKSRMSKAIDALRSDLMGIRTGRASPALVERLSVDYYGQPTPLQQLASISIPDAQTISIRPYTPSDIPAIEKAIATSELGLNPNSDGQQIRLNIPALTEDRRHELSRHVKARSEEARVAIRNIRRDEIKDLQDMERENLLSEDELHRAQDQVQDVTNQFVKQVDTISDEKEQEIMTV